MKKVISLIMVSLIALTTFALYAPQVLAEPDITWASTTSLPVALGAHTSVAYDGRIYVLGGYAGYGVGYDKVYYCDVNPNGSIDSWHSTTPLPDDRMQTVALAYGDHVYLLGGEAMPGPTWQSEVWRAEIQADGSLDPWVSTTSLPRGVGGHGGFEWNGRLYVVGGWTGYGFRRETYFAEIQPDGSLGSWTPTEPLPMARGHGISAIAHNGYAYALGGQAPDLHAKTDIWYAEINSDGTLDPWTSTKSMPVGLVSHAVAIVDNELYVVGGLKDPNIGAPSASSEVYRAHTNSDGTLGSWIRDTDLALPISFEPRGHVFNQAPVWNNRIYTIGGINETGHGTDTVYYTAEEIPVCATVDIDPDTLNLRSNGQWITAYIELPEEHSVSGINVSSILLNGSISIDSEAPTEVADYDVDSIADLMVKFERASVIELLGTVDYGEDTGKSVDVALVITGEASGTPFEGVDTIRVLLKG